MDLKPLLRNWFTLDWRRVDPIRTVLLVLLILAAGAALWQWITPRVKILTQNQFHPVPVIKEVKSVQKVYVPCPEKGLIALDKRQVADKLDLHWLQGGDIAAANGSREVTPPQAGGVSPVAGNPADLQVTATAAVPESKNGVDVIAVTNTATGETTLVAQEKAAPWFQFRNDAAVGIRYGVDQRLQYVGDVYGRWDFLRVKDIYLSANGNLSTGGDARVQFGAEYRWK